MNKMLRLLMLVLLPVFSLSVGAEENGVLLDLQLEDTAQQADFTFDKAVSEYDLTVYEEVYGVRFTPVIEGEGTIKVTMSGSRMDEEVLEIADGEQFELHLPQPVADVQTGIKRLENDCMYSVVLQAANSAYTIHIRRPGTGSFVERFRKRTWVMENGEEMFYWLYVPENYRDDREYPVVVYLHGGSMFRVDAENVLTSTMQATAFAKYETDAIVIVPHGNYTTLDYEGDFKKKWAQDDMSVLSPFAIAAMDILEYICERYSVDHECISVAGVSQGGRGAAALIRNYPDVFSAGLICAPAFDCLTGIKEGKEIIYSEKLFSSAMDFARAVKTNRINIVLIHAVADPKASVEATNMLQEVLDIVGADYSLMIYPNTVYLYPSAHYSWIPYFADARNVERFIYQGR